MSIDCQWNVNWLSMECHSTAYGIQIEYQLNCYWLHIGYKETFNLMHIWDIILCHLSANLMPIDCKSEYSFISRSTPWSFPDRGASPEMDSGFHEYVNWVPLRNWRPLRPMLCLLNQIHCQSCHWTATLPMLCQLTHSSVTATTGAPIKKSSFKRT